MSFTFLNKIVGQHNLFKNCPTPSTPKHTQVHIKKVLAKPFAEAPLVTEVTNSSPVNVQIFILLSILLKCKLNVESCTYLLGHVKFKCEHPGEFEVLIVLRKHNRLLLKNKLQLEKLKLIILVRKGINLH